MVENLCKELTLKAESWKDEIIETIYFGGGTPSLLAPAQIEKILASITQEYRLSKTLEITLEANPDDITREYLTSIAYAGINRISLGTQTFDDSRLKFINRAHSSQEALSALELIKTSEIENFSIDLIYAIPPDNMNYWVKDLDTALSFEPPHISLYGLTIEEQTVFGNWKKKGKIKEVDEGMASDQYRHAVHRLQKAGFEHYEVSNFAKPGFESRHNNGYWSGQPYLGIGPGAHSYHRNQRMYNISNNAKYLKALENDEIPQSIESLSRIDQINESLFTGLRTSKGLNLTDLKRKFGVDLPVDYRELISDLTNRQLIIINNGQLTLTSEGFMLADEITYRMFYEG